MTDPDTTVWICKACKKDFYSEQQLLDHSGVHMGRHEKGVYRCDYNGAYKCKFITADRETMISHKKEMHGEV